MEISSKELRSHAKLVLDAAQRGEPVTIAYRGQPRACVVRIEDTGDDNRRQTMDSELFGLWADRKDLDDVAAHVRTLRRSRFP